jgi:NADH dehydrogenase/NADH:ubiquinone oxidoreductase subunit G
MAEQKQITLVINDRKVVLPAGTLVIEAAKRLGIEVPSFCYYPGLSLQAACRMCLVEVEKVPKLQTACTLAAMDGMVVRTETEVVKQGRNIAFTESKVTDDRGRLVATASGSMFIFRAGATE